MTRPDESGTIQQGGKCQNENVDPRRAEVLDFSLFRSLLTAFCLRPEAILKLEWRK